MWWGKNSEKEKLFENRTKEKYWKRKLVLRICPGLEKMKDSKSITGKITSSGKITGLWYQKSWIEKLNIKRLVFKKLDYSCVTAETHKAENSRSHQRKRNCPRCMHNHFRELKIFERIWKNKLYQKSAEKFLWIKSEVFIKLI